MADAPAVPVAGETEPVTLELCVCGECFECPDGWHYGDDLPCSCTPDCVLEEGDDDHGPGCDGPLNCVCPSAEGVSV